MICLFVGKTNWPQMLKIQIEEIKCRRSNGFKSLKLKVTNTSMPKWCFNLDWECAGKIYGYALNFRVWSVRCFHCASSWKFEHPNCRRIGFTRSDGSGGSGGSGGKLPEAIHLHSIRAVWVVLTAMVRILGKRRFRSVWNFKMETIKHSERFSVQTFQWKQTPN